MFACVSYLIIALRTQFGTRCRAGHAQFSFWALEGLTGWVGGPGRAHRYRAVLFTQRRPPGTQSLCRWRLDRFTLKADNTSKQMKLMKTSSITTPRIKNHLTKSPKAPMKNILSVYCWCWKYLDQWFWNDKNNSIQFPSYKYDKLNIPFWLQTFVVSNHDSLLKLKQSSLHLFSLISGCAGHRSARTRSRIVALVVQVVNHFSSFCFF